MGEFPAPPPGVIDADHRSGTDRWRERELTRDEFGSVVGGSLEVAVTTETEGRDSIELVSFIIQQAGTMRAEQVASSFKAGGPQGRSAVTEAQRLISWLQTHPGEVREVRPGKSMNGDAARVFAFAGQAHYLEFVLARDAGQWKIVSFSPIPATTPRDAYVRMVQAAGVAWDGGGPLIAQGDSSPEGDRERVSPIELTALPESASWPTEIATKEDALKLAARVVELYRKGGLEALRTRSMYAHLPETVARCEQVLRCHDRWRDVAVACTNLSQDGPFWEVLFAVPDGAQSRVGKLELHSVRTGATVAGWLSQPMTEQAALDQNRTRQIGLVDSATPRPLPPGRRHDHEHEPTDAELAARGIQIPTVRDPMAALAEGHRQLGEIAQDRPSLSEFGMRRVIARQVGVEPNQFDYFTVSYGEVSTAVPDRRTYSVGTLLIDPTDPTKAVTQFWSRTQDRPGAPWEGDRTPRVERTDRLMAELVALSEEGGPKPLVPDPRALELYQALLSSSDPAIQAIRQLCQTVQPDRLGATQHKDKSGVMLLDFAPKAESPWYAAEILYQVRGGTIHFLRVETVSRDRTGHRGAGGQDPELITTRKALEAVCTVSLAEPTQALIERTLGQEVKRSPYGEALNTFITWLALGRTDEAVKFLQDQAADRKLLKGLVLAPDADYDTIILTIRGTADPTLVTIPTTSGPLTVELVFRGGRWLIQSIPPSRRAKTSELVRDLELAQLSGDDVDQR